MARPVTHRYEDPLDGLWVETARRVGLTVERSDAAYATTDGRGRLFLATGAGFDADDSVAQMVLHEICHSLVMGSGSFADPDWGLDNETDRDIELEHACLRLQAALLDRFGLRRVLAPTTDYRAFYDELGPDPFEERARTDRESVVLARAAYARRSRRPWGPHLEEALGATARVVDALRDRLPEGHVFSRVSPAPAMHASGIPLAAPGSTAAQHTCGDCAWFSLRAGARKGRCTQSGPSQLAKGRFEPTTPACSHHEPEFDCIACGACCREAYDTVEVGPRDPAKKRHLHLMTPRQGGYDMARQDGRCICLSGGQPVQHNGHHGILSVPSEAPFLCSIYEERPKTCRDFTRGSQHCLEARRKVGLSL